MFNRDCPLGFARQFGWLGGVHSLGDGQRADAQNDRKAAANAQTGAKHRLMDNLGLSINSLKDSAMNAHQTSRRLVLSRSAALIGAAASGALLPALSLAQTSKVRVGLMLPYTGTYAALGVAIENGFRLAVDEQGGTAG